AHPEAPPLGIGEQSRPVVLAPLRQKVEGNRRRRRGCRCGRCFRLGRAEEAVECHHVTIPRAASSAPHHMPEIVQKTNTKRRSASPSAPGRTVAWTHSRRSRIRICRRTRFLFGTGMLCRAARAAACMLWLFPFTGRRRAVPQDCSVSIPAGTIFGQYRILNPIG